MKNVHVHCVPSQNGAFVHCNAIKENMENGKLRELFLASSQFDSELSTQKPPQQQHMPDIRRGTKIETFQF